MLSSEGLTATYVVDSLVSLVPMGRGDGYHKMDVPVSVCVCVCVYVCARVYAHVYNDEVLCMITNLTVPQMVFLEFLDCLLHCAVQWYSLLPKDHSSLHQPTNILATHASSVGDTFSAFEQDRDRVEQHTTSDTQVHVPDSDTTIDMVSNCLGQSG